MIPNNVLSTTPIPGPFLPPRTVTRSSAASGRSDVHFGGVAVGDSSLGISYQLWTCFTDGTDIWLSAPNTPAFVFLPSTHAIWVALAFDQNARAFVAYADANGATNYYWFDSTINSYRTSPLPGVVFRPFASLDDSRPALLQFSDVLLAYVRTGRLLLRAQRDRFGVEYNLATAPGSLVQIGMNHADRFQFAFQNVQGGSPLPPAEWGAQTMNGQPL